MDEFVKGITNIFALEGYTIKDHHQHISGNGLEKE